MVIDQERQGYPKPFDHNPYYPNVATAPEQVGESAEGAAKCCLVFDLIVNCWSLLIFILTIMCLVKPTSGKLKLKVILKYISLSVSALALLVLVFGKNLDADGNLVCWWLIITSLPEIFMLGIYREYGHQLKQREMKMLIDQRGQNAYPARPGSSV